MPPRLPPAGPGGGAAGEASGQDLAHEGDGAALVFAERAERAGAVGRVAVVALERAVELGRVAGEAAVRGDQRALAGSACRRCWRPAPCPRRPRWWRGRAAGAGRPGCGTPIEIGLVPNRRSTPPNGATISPSPTLTKWIETSPASAARSAQSPTRPICPALRSATTASPAPRALAMPRSTACGATVWPRPWLPSTTAWVAVSVTMVIERPANTLPSCSHCT